jgi:hypothetical protein
MEATPATRDALVAAICALMPSIPPSLVIPPLRRLLHAMTAEAPPRQPVPTRAATPKRKRKRKPTTRQVPGPDDWPQLRDQVRQALQSRGVSRADLAERLGVTEATLGNHMAPGNRSAVPGPETTARYRRWLLNGASKPAEVAGTGAATFPAPPPQLVAAGEGRDLG